MLHTLSCAPPTSGEYLEIMSRHFAIAALWAGNRALDENGDEWESYDENFSWEDFSAVAMLAILEDCAAFIEENEDDLIEADRVAAEIGYSTERESSYSVLGYGPEQAGHDFLLTRCGHGVGFWDRGLGDVGERLSDSARVYGDINLWDDGTRVYLDI